MKLINTKKVTHRGNDEYECLLIQFEKDDKNYFHDKKNWLPKHSEVILIVKRLIEIEPKNTKKELFDEILREICKTYSTGNGGKKG